MEKLFRASLDSFEVRGVTDEDVAKFKGGIEAQYINSLQSVAGKVSQLAAFQTFTGNPNKIGELSVKNVYCRYKRRCNAGVQSVYKNKACCYCKCIAKSAGKNDCRCR